MIYLVTHPASGAPMNLAGALLVAAAYQRRFREAT